MRVVCSEHLDAWEQRGIGSLGGEVLKYFDLITNGVSQQKDRGTESLWAHR